MNQISMDYEQMLHCIQPAANSQAHKLLMAFYDGHRLTTMEAFSRFGITTISQRCGELKKLGWPIKCETVPGKTYKRYWIDFQ